MGLRALPPPPPKGHRRSPMERRHDAVKATVAKFAGKPFSWRNERDCGRMAKYFLSEIGNPLKLSRLGSYRNAAGARAALRRCGFENLPEALDSHLERIPFARILPGDIVQTDCGDGPFADLGALGIYAGSNTAFMYHEDGRGPVFATLLEEPLAVWRSLK